MYVFLKKRKKETCENIKYSFFNNINFQVFFVAVVSRWRLVASVLSSCLVAFVCVCVCVAVCGVFFNILFILCYSVLFYVWLCWNETKFNKQFKQSKNLYLVIIWWSLCWVLKYFFCLFYLLVIFRTIHIRIIFFFYYKKLFCVFIIFGSNNTGCLFKCFFFLFFF